MSVPCIGCMEYKRAYEHQLNMNKIYRSVLRTLLTKLNNNDDNNSTSQPHRVPRDSVSEL